MKPNEATPLFAALTAAVRANCAIADARHAGDLTLCNYLLDMRELYRWEQGIALGAPLARNAVGQWIADREQRWEALEAAAFHPLPPLGHDPFDTDAVNRAIEPLGLAYGAGLAGRERAGFFLADRIAAHRPDVHGPQILVCGRELARGLFAPPAALAGDTVILRRESLARWLWELVEGYSMKRRDGPLRRVIEAYALEHDFYAGLPRALEQLGEVLLWHELGEYRVGRRFGDTWSAMRLAQTDRRVEPLLRAVRDLLADLDTTLPALLERGADPQVEFWFATFGGLRASLAPVIAGTYPAWHAGDRGDAMRATIERARAHFLALAERCLALHRAQPDAAGGAIRALLESKTAVFADGN